jgi:hypothetical protein
VRTLLPGERARLAQQALAFHPLVEVENVDGTWVDITPRFVSADITTDVDQPVWSAVIAFARDDAANTASLSPLRSDSTLNVDDDDDYAPLLTAGRQIRLSVATLDVGDTPTEDDYRLLFWGRIDAPKFGTTPMTVECRDLGGLLIDRIIDTAIDYGDEDDPVPVADVMQQILNDTLGTLAPTLVVADPSDYVVTKYKPRNIPVMEAMSALATKAGGLVARYRIGDDNLPAFTMYDPVRAKTTPDATIPPTEYLEVPDAAIDKTNVRNRIRGEFLGPVTGELVTLEVEDTASQNAGFGVMFMQLGADVLDGLTANEVLTVLTAALSDLKYPKFDHVVGSLLFWPSEVGDLYRFPANAVHYDDDQDLAVMGIAHHLENGHGTTRWTCRGNPAGAYLEWIRRQGTGPTVPEIPPAPILDFLVAEGTQYGGTRATVDGAVWPGYRLPKGVDEMRIHALLGDGPNLGVPNIDSTTGPVTIRRPEGDIGQTDEYASIVIMSTRPDMWKRILAYSVRGGLTSKYLIPPAIQAVDPSPTPEDGTVASLTVARDGGTNTVTVTPGTLEPTLGTNYVCIVRNKHILPPIPIGTSTAPVVFVDSGLEPSAAAAYAYEAFIANIGPTWCVTGGKRLTIAEGPTIEPPQFANGTPIAAIVSNVQKVQVDWTGATPGAAFVRVEASIDGATWRPVGTGALASGTVYDSVTGPKLYRLVAYSLVTGDVVTSPNKWYTGTDNPLSTPGALPQFVNGTPKVVFGSTFPTPTIRLAVEWKCATPGAGYVAVTRSTAGSGGPYTTVPGGLSAKVSNSAWTSPDATYVTTEAWYKLEARASDGTTVLASSASVHWVPPA